MRATSRTFARLLDWRLKFAVAAALLMPLIIYALIAITLAYRDNEYAAEAAALSRAQQVSAAVDARLDSSEDIMQAITVLQSVQERRWLDAKKITTALIEQNPDWENITIWNLPDKQKIFEVSRGTETQLKSEHLKLVDTVPVGKMVLSDLMQNPVGTPSLHALMRFRPSPDDQYVLQVVLSPSLVQQALMNNAPSGGTSAVVDRRGIFVARTIDWERRIGKLSTPYVRNAISRGTKGFYRGVTWEGMENYTAFYTSPRSQLSSHVAVTATLIDNRKQRGRIAAGFIALLTFALAATILVLILRFAAARRAASERIEHAQRLEAVGQLTGGIAHDFNNMLAIVVSSLDLAERRLAKGDTDIGRFIDTAKEGAGRAAELTRRLLAFSRNMPLSPTSVDVNAVIQDSVEILKRTLPANIAISVLRTDSVQRVFVDRSQLENVLVNLVVNARDAIADSGTVTISSRNNRRDDGSSWVALTVTDNGRGMTPEVAARAFEPFFTTKPLGKGTGLGLSQISGFVAQSGGEISIDSNIGRGTTVTILLPPHNDQTSIVDERSSTNAGKALPIGSPDEVILLVEDEEQLRANVAYALQSAGYTVLQARSAEDALSLIEHNQNIRVLLSDVMLPNMNGRKLAERAQDVIPDLKVLLMTGFDNGIADDGVFEVLHKPFEMFELGLAVRNALDRDGGTKL